VVEQAGAGSGAGNRLAILAFVGSDANGGIRRLASLRGMLLELP